MEWQSRRIYNCLSKCVRRRVRAECEEVGSVLLCASLSAAAGARWRALARGGVAASRAKHGAKTPPNVLRLLCARAVSARMCVRQRLLDAAPFVSVNNLCALFAVDVAQRRVDLTS
jgi:hypothetical protein